MAFSGRATYDDFDSLAEDVSDVVSVISPFETPLLDFIGDAPNAGTNVAHEWVEDSLAPGSITSSTAINSATADTSFQIKEFGDKLVVGDTIRFTGASSLTYEELMQVTVVVGANSITVSRGFGGVGPSSLAPGGTIELVANASLEGKDAAGDISMSRTRQTNYMQIFDKPYQVSGTERAVQQVGGIGDELEYQAVSRLKEGVRDLERAATIGETSGNSIGSGTAYRTMKGAWRYLTTNVHTVATFSNSFLNSVIRAAWTEGGADLDVIVAGALWKDEIDALAAGRIRTTQEDDAFRTEIRLYQSSYGTQAVIASRWMFSSSLMILSTERMNVVPLKGRSFQREELSKAGDYTRGHYVGEYTLEFKNEAGAARAWLNG